MSSQSKTAQQPVSGKNADKVFKGVAYTCGILILVVLAAVALFLLFRAWPLIGGDQRTNSDVISSFTGGKATSFWGYVGPLLFGTVLVAALALIIAFFVSIRHRAVHLALCAQNASTAMLSYIVDILAAIPSVIYGLSGRPCARPGNLSVLELDRRASRMDPHLRRPGLEPAAHRGDGGTRARHHDPADHHVDHARHLPADPQAA